MANTKTYLSTKLLVDYLTDNAINNGQNHFALRVEGGGFKYPVATCNTHYILQPDWSPT